MDLRASRHFFILGAAKAGTTSLHAWLDQHPAVQMSDPKEPFFFESEYERGLDYYHATYFRGADGQRLLGDARHRNLYFPYIPARIHSLFPEARLIAVLRNPVDRAYAHWWHWYRLGREALSFQEAIEADATRIRAGVFVSSPAEITEYGRRLDADGMGPYRTYLDSGYYAEQLERYLALFRKGQLMVILFEDLIADPRQVFIDTCNFLEIDPSSARQPDFSPRNSSGRLRWRHARDKILARLWRSLRTDPLSLMMRAGRKQLLARPPLEPEQRMWLQQHYRPHNARLQKMLGRDLSGWG
jgi:hypothetical protein